MPKSPFVLALGLLLTSCATQIQMTCIVPSKVALKKGSTLEIQAKDSGTLPLRSTDTMQPDRLEFVFGARDFSPVNHGEFNRD